MRFHLAIQAIPAALTLLKRGVWAVWFCRACARGRRFSLFGAPVWPVSPGKSLHQYAVKAGPACPEVLWQNGALVRWRLIRLQGNIREGPD